jgi:hypothetical protein
LMRGSLGRRRAWSLRRREGEWRGGVREGARGGCGGWKGEARLVLGLCEHCS